MGALQVGLAGSDQRHPKVHVTFTFTGGLSILCTRSTSIAVGIERVTPDIKPSPGRGVVDRRRYPHKPSAVGHYGDRKAEP
jgi:hypothetical protein